MWPSPGSSPSSTPGCDIRAPTRWGRTCGSRTTSLPPGMGDDSPEGDGDPPICYGRPRCHYHGAYLRADPTPAPTGRHNCCVLACGIAFTLLWASATVPAAVDLV